MFQLHHIDKFLAAILLFVFVGCSHGGGPPSSPEQATGGGRQIAGPKRYETPDGFPVNMIADGSLVEGVLIAKCVIIETGSVDQCRIIKNPFATKNEVIVALLQTHKFAPIIFKGEPQRVNYTFRIRFKSDEYTSDLHKICRVHQITGKPPKLGFRAVSQWLLDNVKTVQALERLRELPNADIPIWLQTLRKDAAANGISPCPFADYWEDFLKRPPTDGETH